MEGNVVCMKKLVLMHFVCEYENSFNDKISRKQINNPKIHLNEDPFTLTIITFSMKF